MKLRASSLVAPLLLLLGACDIFNPSKSEPLPDYDLVGVVTAVAATESSFGLQMEIKLPEDLKASGKMEVSGEKLTANLKLTSSTVLVHNQIPVSGWSWLKPGVEVGVVPISGSCSMSQGIISCTASVVADMRSFRLWRLPKSVEEWPEERLDETKVNTAAVERSPVPVADGRVIYFSRQLRAPYLPGGAPVGPSSGGLLKAGRAWPFRCEFKKGGGHEQPVPVKVDGLKPGSLSVMITWVSDDETKCLMTLTDGEKAWVAVSSRSRKGEPWGKPEKIEDSAGDASYLSAPKGAYIFSRFGDLYLFLPGRGKEAKPLDVTINTSSEETCPRVGAANELFFVRAGAQLRYKHKLAREIRLPGMFRVPISCAAPTYDGRWLLAMMPRFVSGGPDFDIVAIPRLGPGKFGEPVWIDDWWPGLKIDESGGEK